MYQQYYGFTKPPFLLESEPGMFYFGESQAKVLAGIKKSLAAGKGIITLSGVPGTGKTTIMRRAMEDSIASDTIVCRIDRSKLPDFIDALKKELLMRQKRWDLNDLKDVELEQLVAKATTSGQEYLIVVDEAHQLSVFEVGELFRLVHLEKNTRKRLKFLLISHKPFVEYFDVAKKKRNQDLLSVHYSLRPLRDTEIFPYVHHRLKNVGWNNVPSFSEDMQDIVFKITKGNPRRINSFFDRLMLFSSFESRKEIDLEFVRLFCRDLFAELDGLSKPDLDSFSLWKGLKQDVTLFEYFEPETLPNKNNHALFFILTGLVVSAAAGYVFLR